MRNFRPAIFHFVCLEAKFAKKDHFFLISFKLINFKSFKWNRPISGILFRFCPSHVSNCRSASAAVPPNNYLNLLT